MMNQSSNQIYVLHIGLVETSDCTIISARLPEQKRIYESSPLLRQNMMEFPFVADIQHVPEESAMGV